MNVSFRYKISKNNLVRKKRFNCLDSNRTVKQMEVADMHILTLIIIFVIASIGAACKGDFSGVVAIGKFVGGIALLICVGLLFCYPLLAIIVGAVVATVVICSSSK